MVSTDSLKWLVKALAALRMLAAPHAFSCVFRKFQCAGRNVKKDLTESEVKGYIVHCNESEDSGVYLPVFFCFYSLAKGRTWDIGDAT